MTGQRICTIQCIVLIVVEVKPGIPGLFVFTRRGDCSGLTYKLTIGLLHLFQSPLKNPLLAPLRFAAGVLQKGEKAGDIKRTPKTNTYRIGNAGYNSWIGYNMPLYDDL